MTESRHDRARPVEACWRIAQASSWRSRVSALSVALVAHRRDPKAQIGLAHELQIDRLRQTCDQRGPLAGEDRVAQRRSRGRHGSVEPRESAKTERALGAFAGKPSIRALCIDTTVASLLALRASALAAMGKLDEARAELGLLFRDAPYYAELARAAHVVELLVAVHCADWPRARELARSRPRGFAIGLREELLGDLTCMLEAASVEQRERVTKELGLLVDVRTFIDAVSPGLIAQAMRVDRAAAVADQLSTR